ncbi:MAG: sulfatase-like hydrolase/transferase, partial [Verrucomicrobiia bacterium]
MTPRTLTNITLFCIASSLFSLNAETETRPPNFIVIFIDDMGYGDIGPFGSTLNRTPNLDQMAQEGMR